MCTNVSNFFNNISWTLWQVWRKSEECSEVGAMCLDLGAQLLWCDPLSLMSTVSCPLWQWRIWADKSGVGRFAFKAKPLSELNNRRMGQNAECSQTDRSPLESKESKSGHVWNPLAGWRHLKVQYVRLNCLSNSAQTRAADHLLNCLLSYCRLPLAS